jgi:hypothetical protein
MYPKPNLARAMKDDPTLIHRVWMALNQIAPDRLLGQGRVYGGGLHKLEPSELANVDATEIAELIPGCNHPADTQLGLFGDDGKHIEVENAG